MSLRKIDALTAEWDAELSSPDDLRQALEKAIVSGDRILLFVMESTSEGLRVECHPARRKSCRTHWLTMVGYLHDWLRRWMES